MILYAVKKIDETNLECRKIYDIYYKNKSYMDVLTYHGPCSSGTFLGLDSKRDIFLIKNILQKIAILEKICAKQVSSTHTVMRNLCIKQRAATDTAVLPSKLANSVDLAESTDVASSSKSATSFVSSLHFLYKKSEEMQIMVTKPQSYANRCGR